MKNITTYLFIAVTLINLLLWKAVSWLGAAFRQALPDMDMSLPALSVWAGRTPIFFLVLAVTSLFCLILSIQDKASERALLITGTLLLLVDVMLLLVAVFGYSMPFISYCPGIE